MKTTKDHAIKFGSNIKECKIFYFFKITLKIHHALHAILLNEIKANRKRNIHVWFLYLSARLNVILFRWMFLKLVKIAKSV